MSAAAADDPRLGAIFAALSDATRRTVIATLLAEGEVSVPMLTERLPITRQAVAKHLATLDASGLVEPARGRGREVRYRLRPGALAPVSAWVREAETAWDARLARLKGAAEGAAG